MNKEFVPYEIALALKELGFDVPCIKGFFEKEPIYTVVTTPVDFNNKKQLGELVSAPIYQQAFRWFREKHGFFCSPTESDDDITKKYDWHIIKNLGDGKVHIRFIGYKDTYEEAELACLKKLIEIIRNKQ